MPVERFPLGCGIIILSGLAYHRFSIRFTIFIGSFYVFNRSSTAKFFAETQLTRRPSGNACRIFRLINQRVDFFYTFFFSITLQNFTPGKAWLIHNGDFFLTRSLRENGAVESSPFFLLFPILQTDFTGLWVFFSFTKYEFCVLLLLRDRHGWNGKMNDKAQKKQRYRFIF